MAHHDVFGHRLLSAHETAMSQFVDAMSRVPADRWTREPAAGRWSAAALSLHVIDSYQYCLRALDGGPHMHARLPRWRMWMLRQLALPIMFQVGRFPREAPAPREVIPDLSAAEALSQPEAHSRLIDTATRAIEALAIAARTHPTPRIGHAYFGPMSPRQTVMLLTGHTRHHADGLRSRITGS